MKNNQYKKQKAGLQNRPEQVSREGKEKSGTNYKLLPFNYRERETNKKLTKEKVLSSLKRWMPIQFELAEVSAFTVSIQFVDFPIRRVRQELSEMGFSWNEKRMSWIHNGGRRSFKKSE